MKQTVQNNNTQDTNNQNKGFDRNAIIFVILTFILHIIACVMFGLYIRFPSQNSAGQFYPIFICFSYGALIIIGFGLLFSYLRKMLWSGMGFTLLITALTIQFYFLVNTFWSKAIINHTVKGQTDFAFHDKTHDFYLTNLNQNINIMSTLTGGFRCALSNLIAFSSILGRAGPLEAFFVVILGTIGYQLNRQILQNYTNDAGTSAIFVFGGIFGIAISSFKYLRQRNKQCSTAQHQNYTSSRSSAAFAFIGLIMIWIFFPILGADYIDIYVATNTPYTALYSIIFALCASTITSFMLSPIFNNGLLIRDIIYGPIAGGVGSISASYWIVNPSYAMVIGFVCSSAQIIFMNVIQKKRARSRHVINTYSGALFFMNGMIGSIFSAIWNAAVVVNDPFSSQNRLPRSFFYHLNTQSVFSWVISLISCSMGILFGAGCGILIYLVHVHQRKHHFDDLTYWLNDDGIRHIQEIKQVKITNQIVQPQTQIYVKQNYNVIKGRKAYL